MALYIPHSRSSAADIFQKKTAKVEVHHAMTATAFQIFTTRSARNKQNPSPNSPTSPLYFFPFFLCNFSTTTLTPLSVGVDADIVKAVLRGSLVDCGTKVFMGVEEDVVDTDIVKAVLRGTSLDAGGGRGRRQSVAFEFDVVEAVLGVSFVDWGREVIEGGEDSVVDADIVKTVLGRSCFKFGRCWFGCNW